MRSGLSGIWRYKGDAVAIQRKREWEEQSKKWREDEDRERTAKSIAASRTQLDEIIDGWAYAQNVERFLQMVEVATNDLPKEQRESAESRLRIAREFLGTQDPMKHFLAWKSPRDRYIPLVERSSLEADDEDLDEEGES